MDIHLLFYYIGILSIFISHILIIAGIHKINPKKHAYSMLIAGSFIAYYFMFKEKMISW